MAIFRLTVDLECHEYPPSHEYLAIIFHLLDRLAEQSIRATFFVNGTAIASDSGRQSVKEIAERGHEIASHGFAHEFVRAQTPRSFADDLKKSRDQIAAIIGRVPNGYRAPYFSITHDVLWAPEIIATAGFEYSSSVLPAYNPQCGFPRAPRRPFTWPCGLPEFPVPVLGFGNFRLPLLGGGYFRLMPKTLRTFVRKQQLRSGDTWTYVHPYDLSSRIPVHTPTKSAPWMKSVINFNRDNGISAYLKLLTPTNVSLGDMVRTHAFKDSLPKFTPRNLTRN